MFRNITSICTGSNGSEFNSTKSINNLHRSMQFKRILFEFKRIQLSVIQFSEPSALDNYIFVVLFKECIIFKLVVVVVVVVVVLSARLYLPLKQVR